MNLKLKNPVLKKILLYFTGTFSTKILSTLMVPIYIMYVTPKELGTFDMQQSIMAVVGPIIVLAIWEGLLKFGIASFSDEKKLKAVITTTYIFSISMMIGAFIILAVVYNYMFTDHYLMYTYIFMIILNPLVTVNQYLTRVLQKNTVFVKSGVYSSVVRLIFIFIFIIYFKKSLSGLAYSFLISEVFIIVYIAYKVSIWKYIDIREFNLVFLKKMLVFSFPLTVNLVLLWVLSGYNRIFINLKFGETANGLYSFATQCATIIAMFGQVINMATLEDALSDTNPVSFKRSYEKTINMIILGFYYISFLFLPFVNIIFNLFNLNQYSKSLPYIPILLLNAIIVSVASNMNNVFQNTGKTSAVYQTTLYAAVFNVGSSFLFAYYWGIKGVLLAQLLGSIVLMLTRYKRSSYILGYKLKSFKYVIYLLYFILLSAISIYGDIKVNCVIGIFNIILIIISEKDKMINLKK